VGVPATLGLIAVVSLPRAFVFRVGLDDPHPFPWLRVKLSCALGQALYPHPQWERLSRLWESFYPLEDVEEDKRRLLTRLEAGIGDFLNILLTFRPVTLGGATLPEVMGIEERQPLRLAAYYHSWRRSPACLEQASPSLVFAALGQAKADGTLDPEEESRLLAKLLTHWALRHALDVPALCAALPRVEAAVPVI